VDWFSQKRHPHTLGLDIRGFGCGSEVSTSMRFLRSYSLEKHHPHIRTHGCRGCCRLSVAVLGLRRGCVSLVFFFRKAPPLPLNVWLLRLLSSFSCGAGTSVSMRFRSSFFMEKRHPRLQTGDCRGSRRTLVAFNRG
jgi:hypothetical protein